MGGFKRMREDMEGYNMIWENAKGYIFFTQATYILSKYSTYSFAKKYPKATWGQFEAITLTIK